MCMPVNDLDMGSVQINVIDDDLVKRSTKNFDNESLHHRSEVNNLMKNPSEVSMGLISRSKLGNLPLAESEYDTRGYKSDAKLKNASKNIEV